MPGNCGLLGLPVVAAVYSFVGGPELFYLAVFVRVQDMAVSLGTPARVPFSKPRADFVPSTAGPPPPITLIPHEQSWCGHAEAEIGHSLWD